MKKNKPGRKEEDVAAKLMGKVKCPRCEGIGNVRKEGVDEFVNEVCAMCKGTRFVSDEVSTVWQGDKDGYSTEEVWVRDREGWWCVKHRHKSLEEANINQKEILEKMGIWLCQNKMKKITNKQKTSPRC